METLEVKSDMQPTRQAKLTSDQIKHWRDILLSTLGPYALMMPDEQVQQIRDEMQRRYGQ